MPVVVGVVYTAVLCQGEYQTKEFSGNGDYALFGLVAGVENALSQSTVVVIELAGCQCSHV